MSTDSRARWGLLARVLHWRIAFYLECTSYCQLKEHNHSKRYYALLDRALPEWREQAAEMTPISSNRYLIYIIEACIVLALSR